MIRPLNVIFLRSKFLVVLCVVLLIAGCASNQQYHTKTPSIDRISQAELERIAPKPLPNLSLEEIVRLSKEGNTPNQIIEKIRASNSSYELTPTQNVSLSQQGVDGEVLDYIHTSRELAWRNSMAEEISKREKLQRIEMEKLKREQLQQRFYAPFCTTGFYGWQPYGYGAFGRQLGSHFNFGAGYVRSWGCW